MILRHIRTACGGGGSFSPGLLPLMSVAVKHVIKERCPLVKACNDERTLVFLYMSASINRGREEELFRNGQDQIELLWLGGFFLILGGDFN